MRKKNVVVDTHNCPRCNAANSRTIIEPGTEILCFIVQVCDKCKLHRIIKTTSVKAYPLYLRLGVLRRMKNGITTKEPQLDKTIKYLEERIEIFELGLTV